MSDGTRLKRGVEAWRARCNSVCRFIVAMLASYGLISRPCRATIVALENRPMTEGLEQALTAERQRREVLERYAASIAMWMEREGVTDQERLSYIKGHPVTRTAARAADSQENKMSGEASAIYDTLDVHTDIEDVKRIARNWMDSAAQHSRNEEYYRGVCHEIGETLFGREAHIADDGGYSESVLVAKLPELAKAAALSLNAAERVRRVK